MYSMVVNVKWNDTVTCLVKCINCQHVIFDEINKGFTRLTIYSSLDRENAEKL